MPLPYLMRRSYQPLKEVLEAELPRTMKLLDINLNTTQMSHVVNSFSELELQPDALEAFQILIKAGWQLIALTNGSENSTRKLLESANAIQHFSSILSCNAITEMTTRMGTAKSDNASMLSNRASAFNESVGLRRYAKEKCLHR